MIRHCVTLKFIDDASDEAKEAMLLGLAELPEAIDAISSYSIGPDVGVDERSWDLIVIAEFADVAGYQEYSSHPAHVAVITDLIKPILAERVAVQYEVHD